MKTFLEWLEYLEENALTKGQIEIPSGNIEPHTFVRFGKFSPNGSSKIRLNWSRDELGGATTERGLSVFGILKNAKNTGKIWLAMPDDRRARYQIPGDYISDMIRRFHKDSVDKGDIFLVYGDLIPESCDDEHCEDQKDEIKELKYMLRDAQEEGDREEIDRLGKYVEKLKAQIGWTYAVGSDGEPIVANARIIRRLNPDELLVDSWGRRTLRDISQ